MYNETSLAFTVPAAHYTYALILRDYEEKRTMEEKENKTPLSEVSDYGIKGGCLSVAAVAILMFDKPDSILAFLKGIIPVFLGVFLFWAIGSTLGDMAVKKTSNPWIARLKFWGTMLGMLLFYCAVAGLIFK